MHIKELHIDTLSYPSEWQNKISIFHNIDFLKLYTPYIHIAGIFNKNEELIGMFYYFKKSKYGIKYIIPPPFHPYNGLISMISAKKIESKNSFIKELQTYIHQYFTDKERAHYIRFVLSPEWIDTQVFYWNKWQVKVHYTYQLSLNLFEEKLFENLSSEKRKSIRKAEKDGLLIKEEKDYSIIKNLVLKTFKRQKAKVNAGYLNKILMEWANPNNSFSYVAYSFEKPIAGVFCVYDTSIAYYLLGGYDDENTHHGAGVTCMWHAILKSKKLGLQKFDFEGSMIPSVEKYFRDFGGTLVPYYVCEKYRLF